jgi:hypothetical protein
MFRVAFVLAALAGASSAESIDVKAQEVIDRSRSSTATYTVYWRVRSTERLGKPDYSWAATFSSGSRRRVENGTGRVVVDCAAGTGLQFVPGIGTGQYLGGKKVAQRNCGINAEFPIRLAKWLGQKESKFGLVDEVEVTDQEGTATYLVTAAGEIVGSTSTYAGSKYITVAEPMHFDRSVPSDKIFSKASLSNSSVPRSIQSRASRPE